MTEFTEPYSHDSWTLVSRATKNNCSVEIVVDETGFDYWWRTEDSLGKLLIWDKDRTHLSDDDWWQYFEGTDEFDDFDAAGNADGMDFRVGIKQLVKKTDQLAMPIHIADYGSNGYRIMEVKPWSDDAIHGVLLLDSEDVERKFGGSLEEAVKAMEKEVKTLDQLIQGELFQIRVYDHRGDLVCSPFGEGIVGLDDAFDIAGDYLLDQAAVCQQCDNDLHNSLGMPCDCVLKD